MHKLSTKQILQQNLDRQPPGKLQELKILLHNVRSMHNVGAAFRSADAFGINEILISGYTPTLPRPEITKTAIGAEKYVDWQYKDDPAGAVEALEDDGYRCVGLEQIHDSILMPDYSTPDA